VASVEIRVTCTTFFNLYLFFGCFLSNKAYVRVVITRKAIPNGKDPCRFAQSIMINGITQIIFEFEE